MSDNLTNQPESSGGPQAPNADQPPIPPQGPNVGQPPAPPQNPPASGSTSGLAIAGLVLGILAILGAFIPLLNILTMPFAIVGLILALVGFAGINKGKHTGRGVAIAGIVLGIVALVVTLGMYGCAGAVASSANSSSSTASAASNTSATSAGSSASASSSSAAASSESAESAGTQEAPAAGDGIIDADKFNAIQTGMSYEEVVAIIGSEGELLSSTNIGGVTASDYQWESDGWGIATVMFQDGAVVNKSQIGVGGSSGAKATLEAFNAIQDGMSYGQVVEIIGGEGQLISESEIAGISMTIYSWDGNSAFSSCEVIFQNGAVSSKSQYGLK